MGNLTGILLVRPNLGKPLVMVPNSLKNFQITIAGKSNTVPSHSEMTHHLRNNPPLVIRRIGKTNRSYPLKIIRVHHAYHQYQAYKGDWTEGVLPDTTEELQYELGFRWEYRVSVGLNISDINALKGREGWSTPLDVKYKNKINHHALYVDEKMPISDSLTVLHITDLHVARRNDIIPEVLGEVRSRYEYLSLIERYKNFNNNLRAVIRYANDKVDKGERVCIVATGDLVDYYHDGFFIWSKGKAKKSTSNFIKLVEIITGRDGKDEALRCPIFTVLGNHDYLIHEPPLCFDVNLKISLDLIKAYDRDSHTAFGLSKNEGREYDYWMRGAPGFPRMAGVPKQLWSSTPAIERRKYVKEHGGWDMDINDDQGYWLAKPRYEHLVTYLENINYDADFTFTIGPHQFVCLNTGHDIYPTKGEFLQHYTIGGLSDAKKDYISDGSHNRGITSSHNDLLRKALSSKTYKGLVFCFTHAPLVGLHKNRTEDTHIIFEDNHRKATTPPNDVTVWLGTHMTQNWAMKGPYSSTIRCIMEKDGLKRFKHCREEAYNYFKRRGYPQSAKRYFKHGQRDKILNFGCADGQVAIFFSLAAPFGSYLSPVTGTSGNRKLAALFAGHTHKIHEFRVEGARTANDMAYFNSYFFLDDYSGSTRKTPQSLSELRNREQWLKNHAPMFVTSGGLKKRVAELREIEVEKDAIKSMRMKQLPRYGKALHGAHYFCSVARIQLEKFKKRRGYPEPCTYIQRAAAVDSRMREMVELMRLYRQFLAQMALTPATKTGLADRYANITLWLNSFGVDFGGGARNSRSYTTHQSWALKANANAIFDETTHRIERIFDFALPESGGNHLLCMWFTYDSLYLANFGGYAIAARNSLDPSVHVNWALRTPFHSVIKDLKEKYRLQFDRLATPRSKKPFLDFCSESVARLATWGVECSRNITFSTNPAHYRSQFVAMDNTAIWNLIRYRLDRIGAALVSSGSGH
jgi:hypothetical protein